MDQPGQANRAPPELEMPTKVREFCASSWWNSHYLSPWTGGGGGGRAGHKWQALSKGGRRHEKKNKIKIKIFEAVGSFDYRFDYLVLSAEFSCSNNNNRSKKYIIYPQEFIVTASSPNASLIGILLDAFFHRLVNNILQWLCFFRLNWLLLPAHYGHCLY